MYLNCRGLRSERVKHHPPYHLTQYNGSYIPSKETGKSVDNSVFVLIAFNFFPLQTRNSDEILAPQMRKLPFLGTDCFICHQKVYIMERLIVERKLFHRSCFRCGRCRACLRPGTYHYMPETETFYCLFDCTRGRSLVLIRKRDTESPRLMVYDSFLLVHYSSDLYKF